MKISKLKSSLRPLHLNIRGYQEPEIVHLVFSLTSKFYNKKSEQMLSFKFHLIIFLHLMEFLYLAMATILMEDGVVT
jgi:hypothetical protein